jgi:hypothetical protein
MQCDLLSLAWVWCAEAGRNLAPSPLPVQKQLNDSYKRMGAGCGFTLVIVVDHGHLSVSGYEVLGETGE